MRLGYTDTASMRYLHISLMVIELPVSLAIDGAAGHDSILGILALHQESDYFHLPIKVVSLDCAHDAMVIHRLCYEHFRINPVIELNKRRFGSLRYEDLKVGSDGIPICPASHVLLGALP